MGGPRSEAPLPRLRWADKQELWDLICKKESGMYARKRMSEILSQHPAIQPRMRAILLDWLIEVCEVYRLHRETFYLAVDFIDRYLSATKAMPKQTLQLIGVTSLFIASKIEEIYPPKLSEFAYVTDGACSEEDILGMELVILKQLNWGLAPMTPNAWLKMFMQVANVESRPDTTDSFVTPQFSGLPFCRVMQLLDLVILDMSSLSHRYSVLATCAFALVHDRDLALKSSGYSWRDIMECYNWMVPFYTSLREDSTAPLQPRSFHNIHAEDQHNIQTHSTELKTLDSAQEKLAQIEKESSRQSPDPTSMLSTTTQPATHLVEMTPPEDVGDVKFVGCNTTTGIRTNTPNSSRSMSSQATVFLSPSSPSASKPLYSSLLK